MLPLPRGWTKAVQASVLHVITLAQVSLACAEGPPRNGRAALHPPNPRLA